MKEITKAFHNQKLIKLNGHNYVLNPITDHIPDTNYALLKDVVTELSKLTDFTKADKIIGEEDRGGYIAGIMAFHHKKSLAMTKWFPSNENEVPGIAFKNAIANGEMYLHGVHARDKVILVEDLIDTGETIIVMIQLLQKMEVELLEVVCIAVKDEYNALEKIKKETGVDVKFVTKFTCVGRKSKIL